MRLLLTLCALLALGSSALASSGRIVGGHDAIIGQFVHQGFVRNYDRDYVCGAWIQSRRWAIAPGYYMFERSISNTFLVFGTTTVDQNGFDYPVSDIIVHPNYNGNTLDNNLALLEVSDGFVWYPYVHPIPIGTEFIRGGVIATLAGWAQGQNDMQYISTRTLTNEECQARHDPENRGRITDSVICVETLEGFGGCLSTAGSALMSGEAIIGSFSWGLNCTAGGFPDVYARMSYYQPWIFSVTGYSGFLDER